jgi:hypothetical protein
MSWGMLFEILNGDDKSEFIFRRYQIGEYFKVTHFFSLNFSLLYYCALKINFDSHIIFRPRNNVTILIA